MKVNTSSASRNGGMISRITYRSMMRGMSASYYQPVAPPEAGQAVARRRRGRVIVKLAILWHMHQPYYEDLATGEHILPWVRLHAIKDYWGMVAMLEEFPDVRVTFNLVPSLVRQVQAFAEDRAKDRHLELGLKPAAELTPDEARWMVANGFHAPYGRMIGPYPRYAQLHAFRLDRRAFAEDDLRDLQVWHKLAWMDPDLLAHDSRLAALVEQGSRVSPRTTSRCSGASSSNCSRAWSPRIERQVRVDRSSLPPRRSITRSCRCCAIRMLTRWRSPARRSRAPVSGAPATRVCKSIEPIAFHEATFGSRPAGMWPSEGSVSDEAVGLMAASGLKWIATDEDILSRSLETPMRPELLYRPYRIGERGPVVLFRDHAMSDRIGFHYQSWNAEAAAADFVEQVRAAGRRFVAAGGGEVATIPVILDGENAWEYYEGGGRPFLRALYRALSAAEDIETVTMAEAATGPSMRLPSIFPGSWINGDFYIWIGHRDDHRAWDQLSAAREVFDERADAVAPEARDRALEELLIAEGSDWFWWYGDDHSSDHDADFDDLFRRHLRNAYAALGVPIPEELFATNITTGAGPDRLQPSGPLAVTLDGRDTSFLEWVGAAAPPLARPGGAMHEVAASPLIADIRIGTSATSLCMRLGGATLPALLKARRCLVGHRPERHHGPCPRR